MSARLLAWSSFARGLFRRRLLRGRFCRRCLGRRAIAAFEALFERGHQVDDVASFLALGLFLYLDLAALRFELACDKLSQSGLIVVLEYFRVELVGLLVDERSRNFEQVRVGGFRGDFGEEAVGFL